MTTVERALLILLIAGGVAALSAIGIGYFRSDGKPDYCYIGAIGIPGSEIQPSFEMRVHRPWREDAHVGAFKSYEEAVKAAERMGCPLR